MKYTQPFAGSTFGGGFIRGVESGTAISRHASTAARVTRVDDTGRSSPRRFLHHRGAVSKRGTQPLRHHQGGVAGHRLSAKQRHGDGIPFRATSTCLHAEHIRGAAVGLSLPSRGLGPSMVPPKGTASIATTPDAVVGWFASNTQVSAEFAVSEDTLRQAQGTQKDTNYRRAIRQLNNVCWNLIYL